MEVKNVVQIENVSSTEFFDRISSLMDKKIEAFKSQPNPNEKISRKEVAAEFNVSLTTVDTWTKEGFLKGFKIGRKVFYYRKDVNNALAEKKSMRYKRG